MQAGRVFLRTREGAVFSYDKGSFEGVPSVFKAASCRFAFLISVSLLSFSGGLSAQTLDASVAVAEQEGVYVANMQHDGAGEVGVRAPAVSSASGRALVNDFIKRMRDGYKRADLFLERSGMKDKTTDLRGLPDGELLILNAVLRDRHQLGSEVLGQIHDRQVYVSFLDVVDALDFPIQYNVQTKRYEGWYIREDRAFSLNVERGVVVSNSTEYKLGYSYIQEGEDFYFPLQAYENWFNLKLEISISAQEMIVDANPPLPIMERIARRKFKERKDRRTPASLPRGDDSYDLVAIPQVDVSLRSTYRNPDEGDVERSQSFNVRTAGDFAYGTLTTNISGRDEDQITNARVTYLQESAYPELLGPLKARRFELGDVNTTRIPLTGSSAPETGVRITNVDPLVRQTLPTTQVSGYILPGWDVELYRENSLLAFRETDENGYYSFDDVRLFSTRNFFRVVAYGPQGQVREETISVPYDPNKETDGELVYDVSFSLQNHQAYRQFESRDEDKDTPHFVGFLEVPLTKATALRLGGRYRQEEGEDKVYASADVSTSYKGAVVNAALASDEDGELGAEASLTKQLGPHNFRADLELATAGYNPGGGSGDVSVFRNSYGLEGPISLPSETLNAVLGTRPRYSVNFNTYETSGGDSGYEGFIGMNTSWWNIGVNQDFSYSDYDYTGSEEEGEFGGNTSISGVLGKNIIRARASYAFTPEQDLESLYASWRRRIQPDLESQVEIGKTLDTGVTSVSGQLNWRPDFARISPRLSYDSEGDIEALLNTSFGIMHSSNPTEFSFSRDLITNTGAINAFVFLDKDGNQIFDGDDEPIAGAKIHTPQNAGGGITNEKGIAFVSKMRPNILTDVYVDIGTLSDPYWIPAREGVSVMPRTGTNVRVDIPVHISGEVDGTVYLRKEDGGTRPLRGVSLSLYSEDGKLAKQTTTAPDGFYLFDLVPPGRYALSVAEDAFPFPAQRPKPKLIEIGYDGTTIFGKDLFVDAGGYDVPIEILADMKDYREQNPHIDFRYNNYEVVLNLGSYNSRLMTSLVWYRMKSRYGKILKDTQLYVPPSYSYALPKTGQHVLRVGVMTEDVDDAYRRCRALKARGFYCTVEFYPTARAQKYADASEQ